MAASVLLMVSAAMNYRFGFSLGKTALDGQIYGMASAAADCFKALVPFFFFAAVRNRQWSQALAAALVWLVVTGYSLTSALGHAALNRLDTTGQRAVAAATYQDLRAEAKRAQEQLGWIPQHRPPATVENDISALKDQRAWTMTTGCTEVQGRSGREFCQQYHKLGAELASAREAEKLEERISAIGAKLAKSSGGTVMAEADPQASVLARVTGFDVAAVQTGLTIFVALLIEVGSGFGMYVAFAHWRLYDARAGGEAGELTLPEMPLEEDEALVGEHAAAGAGSVPARLGANDNRTSTQGKAPGKAQGKALVPESDVQRFYRERVLAAPETASLTSTELYEDYCAWCEEQDKVPFAHPRVTREIGELGVRKERIGKRTRYFGIGLKSARVTSEASKPAPLAA
jgi:hypothetical protein